MLHRPFEDEDSDFPLIGSTAVNALRGRSTVSKVRRKELRIRTKPKEYVVNAEPTTFDKSGGD